jgi:hypothetical protein
MDKSSHSLIISDSDRAVPAIGPELDEAVEYARAAKSPATRRAYRSDFEIFQSWCTTRQVCPLPALPETVAAFLASEAKRQIKPSTISRRLAAIRYAHKLAGLSSPTTSEAVNATLRGIKRTIQSTPCRKTPATSNKIAAMAVATGKNARGLAAILHLNLPRASWCPGPSLRNEVTDCGLVMPTVPEAPRHPTFRLRLSPRSRGLSFGTGPVPSRLVPFEISGGSFWN